MSDNTRLDRLNISHYGPLRDIDIDFENGFNAFYGRNESGKTLIVEAIESLLSDKESDRISQRPNGFLKVEKNNELFDAETDGLEKILKGVTVEDIRNAFVIRDVDLRRPERSNSFNSREYYRDVTDRVLGSRTQKIESLRDEISELGFLTNSTSEGKLENRRSTGKLCDHRKDAKKLVKEMNSFLDKTKSEELFSKFRKLDKLTEKISDEEELIEKIEDKEKEEKHSRGLELIEEVEKANENIERLETEKEELEELRELKRDAEEFEELNKDTKTTKYGAIGSGILSGISLVAFALNPIFLSGVVAVIFLITAGYSTLSYRKAINDINENRSVKENIIKKGKARGPNVDSLPELIRGIEDYSKEVSKELNGEKERKNEALGELKGKFNEKGDDLDDWKKILDDFSEKFNSQSEEFNRTPSEAREELKQMEKEKEEIEEKISSHRKRIENFDKKFSDTVKEKFLERENLDIESLQDVEKGINQLESFVDRLDQEVETSRKAIEILEEMEEEEGDEFNKMFKEDSYASEMFREATEGNYTDIKFDKDSQELKVKRSDGKTVSPEELSQGTYDLLYMSIRLGLAREILDSPGFIIMDNAFTHSDIQRIEKEFDFLNRLEEEGWQIIYLTYRDDVKEKLEAYTDVKELDKLDY